MHMICLKMGFFSKREKFSIFFKQVGTISGTDVLSGWRVKCAQKLRCVNLSLETLPAFPFLFLFSFYLFLPSFASLSHAPASFFLPNIVCYFIAPPPLLFPRWRRENWLFLLIQQQEIFRTPTAETTSNNNIVRKN